MNFGQKLKSLFYPNKKFGPNSTLKVSSKVIHKLNQHKANTTYLSTTFTKTTTSN